MQQVCSISAAFISETMKQYPLGQLCTDPVLVEISDKQDKINKKLHFDPGFFGVACCYPTLTIHSYVSQVYQFLQVLYVMDSSWGTSVDNYIDIP